MLRRFLDDSVRGTTLNLIYIKKSVEGGDKLSSHNHFQPIVIAISTPSRALKLACMSAAQKLSWLPKHSKLAGSEINSRLIGTEKAATRFSRGTCGMFCAALNSFSQ